MVLDAHILGGDKKFESKFVRVGNEIYITEPGDLKTLHVELSKKDKVLERIYELKSQEPNNVDGGIIFVEGRIIQVGSHSTSLSLPLTKEARKITLQKLKQSFPDFNIKELGQDE